MQSRKMQTYSQLITKKNSSISRSAHVHSLHGLRRDSFRRHGVHHRLFADDMRGYCSGRLDDVPAIVSQLESCIVDIYAWRGAKRLHLGTDKTNLLWFGPASAAISEEYHPRQPGVVVRDLGVWFDAYLSMRSHVSPVAGTTGS